MTDTTIGTANIRIEPELDLAAFAADVNASVRASVAAELRRLADELDPAEVKPPRYELVKDRTGDYGIRDTELDIVAAYAIDDDEPEEVDKLRATVARLNSGELRNRDIPHWGGSTYGPFTPVDR